MNATMAKAEGREFARSLSSGSLLSFTLSALSPAVSVFITGAGVLRIAGTGAAVAIVLGALLAILAAVQYAEVADAAPHAGGLYAGVNRMLGGWASFMILALSLIASPAYLAFSGLGLADYLTVLVPGLPRLPIAAAAIGIAAALAMLRLHHGARIAGLFLALELLAVLGLAAVALAQPVRGIASAALHPVIASPQGTLVATPAWQMVLGTVTGAWACSGMLWGTYLGEDVKRRGASFGSTLAVTGIIGAALVCAPILAVALSMSDPVRILSASAPLASFVADRAGLAVARGISFIVVVAIFNNLMTMTLALARLLFATGRDHIWPAPLSQYLSRINSRTGAPIAATALLALVSMPCLLLSERFLLIVLSAELFSPFLIALSVLLGRRSLEGQVSFRSPFYPLLSLLGLASVGLFVVADWYDPTAGRPGLFVVAVVVAGSSLLYFRRARRSDSALS